MADHDPRQGMERPEVDLPPGVLRRRAGPRRGRLRIEPAVDHEPRIGRRAGGRLLLRGLALRGEILVADVGLDLVEPERPHRARQLDPHEAAGHAERRLLRGLRVDERQDSVVEARLCFWIHHQRQRFHQVEEASWIGSRKLPGVRAGVARSRVDRHERHVTDPPQHRPLGGGRQFFQVAAKLGTFLLRPAKHRPDQRRYRGRVDLAVAGVERSERLRDDACRGYALALGEGLDRLLPQPLVEAAAE